MWEYCRLSSLFHIALQFLCCGEKQQEKKQQQQKPAERWKQNISEGYFCSFRLSLPLQSLSLCSCSWEFLAEAGARGRKASRKERPAPAGKIRSFCFEMERNAQHQTTRPHGHIPNITTSLYYQCSKKFIAPPHFHHYLYPPHFQKRASGKS